MVTKALPDEALSSAACSIPVLGGDLSDCINSSELDAWLSGLIAGHYVHARAFFEVRTSLSEQDALELGKQIMNQAAKMAWVLFPLHVRHHWTSGIIFNDGKSYTINVYDSCPSPITARDMEKGCRRMGLPKPTIICHARQPPKSNQCGLHVLLIAIVAKYGQLPGSQRNPPETVDLHAWRQVLAQTAPDDSVKLIQTLSKATPEVAKRFGFLPAANNPSTVPTRTPLAVVVTEPAPSITALQPVKTFSFTHPKRPLCCYYLQDRCRFGVACRFTHGGDATQACQFSPSCGVGHGHNACVQQHDVTLGPSGGASSHPDNVPARLPFVNVTVPPPASLIPPYSPSLSKSAILSNSGEAPTTWTHNPYGGGGRTIMQTLPPAPKARASSASTEFAEVGPGKDKHTPMKNLKGVYTHVPALDNPLVRMTRGMERDAIHVDAEDRPMEERRMISLQDLQGVGLHREQTILDWFRQKTEEAISKRKEEVEVIVAERDSLPPTERRHRVAEFRRRLMPVEYSPRTVRVRLADAPPAVRNNPDLWQRINALAAKMGQNESLQRRMTDARESLTSYVPGRLLSSAIITTAISYLPDVPSWTVIGPEAMTLFANTGRLQSMPRLRDLKTNIAAIIFGGHHFALVTYRVDQGQIEIRDSLNGPHPGPIYRDFIPILGRFRMWLRTCGLHNLEQVASLPCNLQALNDCGLEALNNLALVLFGNRGRMTRELIRELHDFVGDPWTAHHIWSRIWLGSTPLAPVIKGTIYPQLPTTHVRKSFLCPLCKDKLGKDGYCLSGVCPYIAPTSKKYENPPEPHIHAKVHNLPCVPLSNKDEKQPDDAQCKASSHRTISSVCSHVAEIQTTQLPNTQRTHVNSKRHQGVPRVTQKDTPVTLKAAVDIAAPAEKGDTMDSVQQDRRCTAVKGKKKGSGRCGAPAIAEHKLCPQHLYQSGSDTCTALSSTKIRCKALVALNNAFCPLHLVEQAMWEGRRAPEPGQPLHEAPLRPTDGTETPPPQPFPSLHEADIISHGAVRAFLRKQHHGAIIKMTWIRAPSDQSGDNACAGTIIGKLDMSKPGYAVVEFLRDLCAGCGLWNRPEDECADLPMPGVVYTELHNFPIDKIPRAACSCAVESTEQVDSSVLDTPSAETRASDPFRAELASDASLGFLTQTPVPTSIASPLGLRGSVGRRWFIHHKRPPHVHSLTWKAAAASTRASHIRWLEVIKGMPHDLEAAPLGPALIECVLRMARARFWGWPTISSSLSTIASALRHLPIYTNISSGINIKLDSAFATASRRAQHLARVSLRNRHRDALLKTRYEVLLQRLKDPIPRLFFQLAWLFAARIGDLRQVEAPDVMIEKIQGRFHVKLTFRFGKGAAWWGPFTLHALCDSEVAKALQALVDARPQGSLFTPSEQATLSALMKDEHLTLRAIRRGSLQYLALCGVPDEKIQLLSGHKRRDTLLRYLGWGRWSSTASAAAVERDVRKRHCEEQSEDDSENQLSHDSDADGSITGAGPINSETEKAGVRVEAPKMGPFSGRCGNHGRKIPPPPAFLPHKAPNHSDLGIPTNPSSGTWPLHAKKLNSVDWQTIKRVVGTEVWEERLKFAPELLESDMHYGKKPQRLYREEEIPISRYSEEDATTMFEADKLEPHTGPIRGFVTGHVVFQIPKRRRRPVFKPSLNATTQIPPALEVHYPSRRERRWKARGMKYTLDFDMSGFFDQFGIRAEFRDYYVLRVRNNDGTTSLWRLTKLPMGATFAPAVAQHLTWALLAHLRPLVDAGHIAIDTMIDNVRICGKDEKTFLWAVKSFLERCRNCGVVLNEPELPTMFTGSLSSTCWHSLEDKELLHLGELRGKTFLGELYLPGDLIANTPKNVEKLQLSWQLLSEYAARVGDKNLKGATETDHEGHIPPPRTVRHVCSLIGLAMWMASTLGLHVSEYQAMIRSYARLASFGAVGGPHKCTGWDLPLDYVAPSLIRNLRTVVDTLLRNQPVPLPSKTTRPSVNAADYDLIIYIDASKNGWGALVTYTPANQLRPITICVRQRWAMAINASTTAEPRAVVRLYDWLRSRLATQAPGRPLRAALITDHAAMNTGQRRWHSHHGGFSANFDLNSAFRAINSSWIETEVFGIEGELNPADGPSRDPSNSDAMQVTQTSLLATESLDEFWHPYRLHALKWWQC